MNIHFQELIPKSFSDQSRVWIYQSNRSFTTQEVLELDPQLNNFAKQWLSHGDDVKGYAKILFDHFILIMADEGEISVSGCSTDASIRFIKDIEKEVGVALFDRQVMAFIVQERVQLIPLDKVNDAIASDFIGKDTLYFNNTILTKKELMEHWIIPVKDSWLARRISEFTLIN